MGGVSPCVLGVCAGSSVLCSYRTPFPTEREPGHWEEPQSCMETKGHLAGSVFVISGIFVSQQSRDCGINVPSFLNQPHMTLG